MLKVFEVLKSSWEEKHMMLNFFVLGLIPGTNIQITFFYLLILAMIVDIAFGIYFIFFISSYRNIYASNNKQLEDGQQLALFN